jgi:3-dehydroquinate synthase
MKLFETTVNARAGNSHITVGPGVLRQIGAVAQKTVKGRRACVVTDSNVCNLHLSPVMESLEANGFEAEQVSVPAGENSKSLEMVSTLWNTFNGYKITRTDLIVALGGGVVGDLAGFAAATYLRGVAIMQIPTSLLAQVDSSVGGKTGIDLSFGKNLAGAFHQPRAVLVDPLVLETLPRARFAEGMAEVVKYGCIRDAKLFADIENFADNSNGDSSRSDKLFEIISRCIAIKADIVNRDEFDLGERMILNFGHTIGHAIENVMGYGYISHGEAVAIGMVAAARLGEQIGKTPQGTSRRIEALLKKLSLPTETEFTVNDIFQTMVSDKKNLSGTINFVLLNKIGDAVTVPFSPAELKEQLARARQAGSDQWTVGSG